MFWYIKFFKVPELRKDGTVKSKTYTQYTIKTTISVTTDLGDVFYPRDLDLVSCLYVPDVNDKVDPGRAMTIPLLLSWKKGNRCLNVAHHFRLPKSESLPLMCLCISSEPIYLQNDINLVNLKNSFLLGIRSDAIGPELGKSSSGMVGREFRLLHNRTLRIWEESGDSIARHIWDSGIMIVAYFWDCYETNWQNGRSLSEILSKRPKTLRVLELGSGCGVVGIAFAQLVKKASVLLTDLPEAMPILQHNVSKAKGLAAQSTLQSQVLDWENDEALSQLLDVQKFDLILVSDCTYNTNSIPSLVKVLEKLVIGCRPHIFLATKTRHDSENLFFDLMKEKGIEVQNREEFSRSKNWEHLPSSGLIPKIEIYTFYQ
ncbi:hypothetical protein MMC25_000094 [Agyrium rufum]|nr:hypothetical protein [Agyrium rufum]